LSGKNWKPCWHKIASNEASGKPMASALAWTHVIVAPAGGGKERATSSMAALISIP
jgi:hypothetical protein